MKIGDYVRFDGEIAKIRDIKRYKTKEDIYVFDRILDLNEDRSCNDNTIYNSQWEYFDNVKSSPRIIDLIKKKDIVVDYDDNIYQVTKVFKDYVFTDKKNKYGQVITLVDYQIKSIVTKEQFEQMEYKVND